MVRELDFVDECYKDKDLNLLKKLTLIIPTYNRNYYLSRCLWYHVHFPFGQIIVADSSPEEKKIVNRETVAKIRKMFNANVLYLEYQPETEKYGGDIYRKWADAIQYVDTEYSMICTDKESLIPSVAHQCIQFLENNSDYVSAGAKKYSICLKKYIYKISKNIIDYHLIQRKPNRRSEINDSVLERMNSAFIKEQGFDKNLLLTICRSEVQKYVFTLPQKYFVNDIRYGELILAYGSYLFGKFHYIDTDIYKIRDIIQFNLTGGLKRHKPSEQSSNTQYLYLSDYFKNKKYDELYLRFKRCIYEELEKHANISKDRAEAIVNHYLTKSLLLFFDSGKPESICDMIYKIRKTIFKLFPYSFKIKIIHIYNNIFHITEDKSLDLSTTTSKEVEVISKLIVSTFENEKEDAVII